MHRLAGGLHVKIQVLPGIEQVLPGIEQVSFVRVHGAFLQNGVGSR